jgi:hypothetical protein
MATWNLAVITSVERLWPHEDSTNLVFALNLQTAVLTDTTLPPLGANDFKLLEPWQWNPLSQVDFWGISSSSPPLGKAFLAGGVPAQVWAVPNNPIVDGSTGTPRTDAINALVARRTAMINLNTLNSSSPNAPFFWDPTDLQPPTPPPLGFYHHLMGSISLTSGLLGEALRLIAVVKIPRSQVDSAFPIASDGSLPQDLQLFAVPRFTTSDGTAYTPVSTGPVSSKSNLFTWSYQGANPATAYTIAVNLNPGIPDPTSATAQLPTEFFNLQSYWVRRQLPYVDPTTNQIAYHPEMDPGTSDWHLRLADGIADAWNLPRHLLDFAASFAALPAQDFAALWKAVLGSVRDRAGMGLLAAADGDSLVSLALERSQLPTDIFALNWIERLRLIDRMTSLQSWQEQLTTALNLSSTALPAVPPPQTAQVEVTWMAPYPKVDSVTSTINATLQRSDSSDPTSAWSDVPGLVNQPLRMVRVSAGQSTAFALSLVADAVSPGWFRGKSVDGSGNPIFTSPVYVASPLVDVLAPLASSCASLQRDDAVCNLVTSLWGQASNFPLTLPVGATSPRSFMEVESPAVPDNAATWSEHGALALDDGDGWAVTFPNINLALPHDPKLSIQTWLPQVVTVWLPQVIKVVSRTGNPIVSPPSTAPAGSYTLTCGGTSVTPDRNDQNPAATIQNNLAPLTNGAGITAVGSYSPNPATIYFSIQFAGPNQPQITAAGTGDLVAAVLTPAMVLGLGQTFSLAVTAQQTPPQKTLPLPFKAQASDLQSALEQLPNVGVGKVAVALSMDPTGTIATYTIAFADQTSQVATSVTTDTTKLSFGISAAAPQLVQVAKDPGTFTLQVGAESALPLPSDATATQVQDALQNMPGVGQAQVETGTDANGNPAYSLTFDTKGLAQVAVTSAGGGNASALMLLTVSGTAGSFTLQVAGQSTTTPLPFNATFTEIQTALAGLSSVGQNNVVVAQYGASPGMFSIVLKPSLPQVFADGTGMFASVSTLVTVVPPVGQFTLTLSTPESTGTQTTNSLLWDADAPDLQKELATALAKFPKPPQGSTAPPVGAGVTVGPRTVDPSGARVYAITFADPTVTLAANHTGYITATTPTSWGSYEVVAASVPSVAPAKTYLQIDASLTGSTGTAGTNQLILTVTNPTLTGTGPITQSATASSGATSHSLRAEFLPASALALDVGGTGGQFTLTSGTHTSSPLNVGAPAPEVQAAVVNITGLTSAQVSVAATTQPDRSVVYVITFTAALPEIKATAQTPATARIVGVLEATIFYTFTGPNALHSDWQPVNFGNQTILVPVDQVSNSAISLTHDLQNLANGTQNIVNPLGGAELLQLAPPVYFTSAAATFDSDLGKQWDGITQPLPVDRTQAFWQTNQQSLTAAVSFASPRRRLALGQTGRLWPVWNYKDTTRSDLRRYIEQQFSSYLTNLADQRFGWPNLSALTSGPYLDFTQDFPNVLSTASAELKGNIEAFLLSFANHIIGLKQLVPPDADQTPPAGSIIPQQQNADLVPTTTPHACSLQVDRFDAETTTPDLGDDQDDHMTHLAGVGVLLRQAAAAPTTPATPFDGEPWRMLNITDLSAPDTTTPGLIDSDAKLIASDVVAPARLYHRNGARHNLITFDNQYLLARSPLADIGASKGFTDRLAFMLAVGGANGSFDLVLTPSGPSGPQHITVDGNGQLNPTIEFAVAALLADAQSPGRADVTPSPGGNGTSVYTIYMLIDKQQGTPVPVLSVPNATPPKFATLIDSPEEDTNSSVFRYDPPSLNTPLGASWARMPSLKFGQMYEARAFLVGNCGALPKDLAPTHPLVLDPSGSTTAPDPIVVRRLRYLRRVGVGAPRLISGQDLVTIGEMKTPTTGGLPDLPPGLTPLAKELGLHVLSANLTHERFFFDPSGRVGQLNPGSEWTVTLPRVTATGSTPEVDTDSNFPVNWQIRFGLKATDQFGNIVGQFSVLAVRAGQTLNLTLDQVVAAENPVPANNPITLTTRTQIVVVQGAAGTFSLTYQGPTGTMSTGSLAFTPPPADAWGPADPNTEVGPLQTALCGPAGFGANNVSVAGFHSSGDCLYTITPAGNLATQTLPSLTGTGAATVLPSMLFGGPIDLQLQRSGNQLSFCWQRSDRDEPWITTPSIVWNLTPADQQVDTTRCYIEVGIGTDPSLAPTFGIPTVTTSSSTSGELTPPPENEPITVLNPASANGSSADGGLMTFAIRPPSVDLQTWARWYDMDLFKGINGATFDVRKSVWIAYEALLPTDPSQNPSLDLSFDDPAVCGLVFELVPLLVEPTSQCLNVVGNTGAFNLICGNQKTAAPVAIDNGNPVGTAQTLQSSLQSLATVGVNNVTVTSLAQNGSILYAITPSNALAGEPLPLILVTDISGVSLIPQLATSVVLTVTGSAGTFQLASPAGSTNPLDVASLNSALIQAALEELTDIGANNVVVTQVFANGLMFTITPSGTLAGQALPTIQATNVSFGLTITFQSAQPASPAEALQPIQQYCDIAKAQLVTVRGQGGTFTLSLLGQVTPQIPVGASEQVVRNALQSLNLPGMGLLQVGVTSWVPADTTATNYSITGIGSFKSQGLPPIQGTGTTPGVTVEVAANRTGLPYVQSAPFIVRVESTTHLPRLEWDQDRLVTVRVGEQEIWELRVYPAVSKTWFNASDTPGSQRFHTLFGACATPNSQTATATLGTPGDRVDPGASVPYYLFSPWRLTIEVATPQLMLLGPLVIGSEGQSPYLPAPTSSTTLPAMRLELAQALVWQAVQPAFDGRSVSVTFDKTSRALISNPPSSSAKNSAAPNLAHNSIAADPRRYRYLTTMQLQRQVWRWQGRPVPDFPFEAADLVLPPAGLAMDPSHGPDRLPIGTPSSGCSTSTLDLNSAVQNLQLWDAAGFGDRSAVDLIGQSTNVGYGAASAVLFSEDLTGDLRALYYRFALQVFSRYAPLFPPSPPNLIASGYDPFASSTSDPALGNVTPWRRLVVPCRWTGDVPRPVVRFVVPLTQSDDSPDTEPIQQRGTVTAGSTVIIALLDTTVLTVGMAVTGLSVSAGTIIQSIDSATHVTVNQPATGSGIAMLTFSANVGAKTPGLLLVLDETAFATGGLSETIEADVVRVDDTYNGTGPVSRPEFGPDPTLTARGWTSSPNGPPPAQAVAMDVVGPLGHTFDTADAPLFVASSYFVHAPEMDTFPNPVGDPTLAWYLIKTRFRRLLVPEGQVHYLPLPALTALAPGQSQSTTMDPPLTLDQDWVISLAQITLPSNVATTLTVQLAADKTSTVTIASTLPAVGRTDGQVSLSIDQPPATVELDWPNAKTSDFVLDLRFVFQLDETTGPATLLKVSGTTGQFTITYNDKSSGPLSLGASGTDVETALGKPPELTVTLESDQRTYEFDVTGPFPPTITAAAVPGAGDVTATVVQELHYSASYRVDSPENSTGLWQILQSATWPGTNWPGTVIAANTSSSATLEMCVPRSLPALVSRFTAPYWVQFLANTQRLVPADASSYQLCWRSSAPTSDGTIDPQFNLLYAGQTPGTWNLSPTVTPVETGSDVAFARVLLLTEVVRDVSGQVGPERYLGLFYLLDSAGTFSCQDRSPALPNKIYEESAIGQISLRVVELQVRAVPIDPQTGTPVPYQFPRQDFWGDIFGSVKNVDTQSAPDAVARIVGVSAPVSLPTMFQP